VAAAAVEAVGLDTTLAIQGPEYLLVDGSATGRLSFSFSRFR
jgi:hypothetical protein